MNERAIDRPYLDVPARDDGWAVRPKPLPPMPKAAEMLPAVPKRSVKAAVLLACVAEAYDVETRALLSADRHRNIAEARGVACWLLRVIKGMSYPEIGRALDGRDHTTCIAAIKKVLRRRESEPEFLAFTDELEKAVRARLEGGNGP